MSTRRFVSRFHFQFLEQIFATLVVALVISSTSNIPAYADQISTSGQTQGSSSGQSDGSTHASFGASGHSKASSVGDHYAGGSRAAVGAGVTQTSSDGPNAVSVSSSSAAGASSDPDTMRAQAIATGNGVAGAVAGNGTVAAAAMSSPDGLAAYAAASDGSYASATQGLVTGVSSYVPNGTTKTVTRRNGTVMISISVSADGSYSFARVSPRGVSATVGMTTATVVASGNIRELVRMTFSARAGASYRSVSASASAQIDAAASNLASQAQAMGFSRATARVQRDGNRVIMTVSGECDRSSWRNIKWKECQPLRKIVTLGKSVKYGTSSRQTKQVYAQQVGNWVGSVQPLVSTKKHKAANVRKIRKY